LYEVVMLEKALTGTKRYYGWMAALLAVIGVGFACYLWQTTFLQWRFFSVPVMYSVSYSGLLRTPNFIADPQWKLKKIQNLLIDGSKWK